jgi:hypothetical protein
MIKPVMLAGILAGLALFLMPANAEAQRSYPRTTSRTTIEYRAGWYPVTPYTRYEWTRVRRYDFPYRGRRWHRHRPWPRYDHCRGCAYRSRFDWYDWRPYGYRIPLIYPYAAYVPAIPYVPVYPYVPAVRPPPVPLSRIFLVTNVVVCRTDDDGNERCDAQAELKEKSRKQCKPILESIVRRRELARGYQVVASFKKRASGKIEATVRVAPMIYHPELTHRRLTSSADTSYHALAVLLLESEPDVE